ncbi:pyruvyl transferase 1 [Biomphalaria glabrata]|nr:pyruvyl transferase 1 [Biomphalaria glabrata]
MGLKAILIVFYAWTLSQFLTYYFAASFVRQIQALFVSSQVHYVPYFQISLALTFLQLINKFIDYHSKNKSPEPLGFLVLETLENLIVNYSFTFLHGSSVYVIKMSQPVTNSLVNRILFKKSGTIEELFGTPFIVLGALSYTLDEPKIRVKRIGIALAVISTFLSAVLAVFRKIFHGGDNIKSSVTVMTMTVWFLWQVSAAITVWMVEMWRVIPQGSSSIVGALFSFGFFHFANQHLSHFMVVKVSLNQDLSHFMVVKVSLNQHLSNFMVVKVSLNQHLSHFMVVKVSLNQHLSHFMVVKVSLNQHLSNFMVVKVSLNQHLSHFMVVKVSLNQHLSHFMVVKVSLNQHLSHFMVVKVSLNQHLSNFMVVKVSLNQHLSSFMVVKVSLNHHLSNFMVVKVSLNKLLSNFMVVKESFNQHLSHFMVVKVSLNKLLSNFMVVKVSLNQHLSNFMVVKVSLNQHLSNFMVVKVSLNQHLSNFMVVKVSLNQHLSNFMVVKVSLNQHLSNFMVVKVMGSMNRLCASLIRKILVVLLLIGTDAHRHSMIALLALVLAVLGMLIRTLGRLDRLDSAVQDGNLDNSGAWMLPPKTYRIAQYFLVLTTLALGVVMVNQYRDLIKQERQRLEAIRKAIKSHEHDYEARMALFMTLKLTDHPDLTDARARTLTDSHAVVGEANRVLIHILADILVSIQETVILSLSDDNSVANMAEKAGAIFLLQKLNKTFYFYCLHSKCNREGRVGWQFLNNKQSKDIALIVQGGHQVFQKPENKMISQLFLETFLHSLVLFLPLNIDPGMKLFETSNVTFSSYFNRSRVYLLLSDRYSLEEAKKYFKNVKTILAPSSSFGFGMVAQRIKPSYDVLILRTKDFQLQKIRKSFPNIRFHVAEMQIGLKFNINSSDVETAMLVVQAGLQFLQKGRVILTDYVYVHILCVLQNIPHVLVEKANVNSSLQFHSSWTAGLDSVIRIDNDDDHLGAESAVKLVQRPNRL